MFEQILEQKDVISEQIISYLETWAHKLPLTIFAFVGSVVEQIIAVIPSPFVPITAGSLNFEQGRGVLFLFVIGLTGALGITLASLVPYFIADKLEDAITHSRFAKFLGIDEDEVEQYGRYLDGTKKDKIIMILLRTLPFVPTIPVSVIAGLIKLNIWTYIYSTFIGSYLRFMFYMILAYEGVRKYSGLLATLDTTDTIIKVTFIITFMGWLFFFLRKKWHRVMEFFINGKAKPKELD